MSRKDLLNNYSSTQQQQQQSARPSLASAPEVDRPWTHYLIEEGLVAMEEAGGRSPQQSNDNEDDDDQALQSLFPSKKMADACLTVDSTEAREKLMRGLAKVR